MGVNVLAALEHHWDAAAVPDLLPLLQTHPPCALLDAIRNLAEADERPLAGRDLLTAWRWTGNERVHPTLAAAVWARGDHVGLDGPDTLGVNILRHLCVISHRMRWRQFLVNPRRQQALRTIYYQFARLTGSPLAVYVPDSGFSPAGILDDAYEGWNMATLLTRLRTGFGPPAPTIASIYQELPGGTWIGPGYYIDHFADLQHDHLSAAADR